MMLYKYCCKGNKKIYVTTNRNAKDRLKEKKTKTKALKIWLILKKLLTLQRFSA